jgi:hypothetical protein
MIFKTAGPALVIRVSGLILCSLMMVSCLKIDTDIQLKRNGSAEAVLEYDFQSDAAAFGRGFGADEPWPLPLTEKDFIQRTLSVPGVELKKYRVKSREGAGDLISVYLEAESLEALSAYLDLDISWEVRDGGGIMTLVLPSPGTGAALDAVMDELLAGAAGDTSFRFSFRPPKKPTSVSPGGVSGRTAVFEISLRSLLTPGNPESWTVAW